MQFMWVCQAEECDYEEKAFLARYCAWCGQDLCPTCMLCAGHIDPATGQCLVCSQSPAHVDLSTQATQRSDLKSLLEHTLARLSPLLEKSPLFSSKG